MKRSVLLLLGLLLTACGASLETGVPRPTGTETPFPTATETVVWFPPTSTPPPPTEAPTPTPLLLPELGDVTFRDTFSSGEEWTLPLNSRGQINVSGGELNVIINEPSTYLRGYRQKPDLTTFFAQITASPNLCAGRDEYGLLFRVQGGETYYRFALSCDGRVRLEKIIAGSVFTLQPWMRSASVAIGAPSESTLQVLADNQEIRLFIDGALQFSVKDSEIQRGSLGVFARSTGETALTVSFSDLVVREVIEK